MVDPVPAVTESILQKDGLQVGRRRKGGYAIAEAVSRFGYVRLGSLTPVTIG